jgi:hypothetical protein
MDGQGTSVLLGVAGLFLVFCIFVTFVIGLYKLLHFVWVRLPLAIISTEWPQLSKFAGTILALILVPRVAAFAWQTIKAIFEFLAVLVGRIGAQLFTPLDSCTRDQPGCINDIIRSAISSFGDTSYTLLVKLNFESFPVSDFLFFLLLALILTQVIGAVLSAVAEGKVDIWWTRFDYFVPEATRSRIVFAILVSGATYLALSAVLAVSFFQSRVQSQQYTIENLDKVITGSIVPQESFDRQYPNHLPELKLGPAPDIQGQNAQYVVRFFIDEQQKQIAIYDRIQGSWTMMRDSAAALPQRLRGQVEYKFRSESEGRIGGREAAEHFSSLILWHQKATQNNRDSLSNCWSLAAQFASSINQVLDQLRGSLVAARARTDINPKAYNEAIESYITNGTRISSDSSLAVLRGCRPSTDADQDALPSRQSFGASLGVIGSWAGWILQSESMPAVIVVGLVGFSLLGATVSRVVRQSLEAPGTRLTLDDLLFVVASGITAAFVVFLAAYGGLAILAGGSASDPNPNPYVVFVTCLVGAVYSEVVWRWARTKLLAPADGETEPVPPNTHTTVPAGKAKIADQEKSERTDGTPQR